MLPDERIPFLKQHNFMLIERFCEGKTLIPQFVVHRDPAFTLAPNSYYCWRQGNSVGTYVRDRTGDMWYAAAYLPHLIDHGFNYAPAFERVMTVLSLAPLP